MSYQIKYNYNTGDSFSNQDGLEGILELEWENIDVAKANLKRIEEHYKQYKELNHFYSKINLQKIMEENKSKDWFVNQPRLAAFEKNSDKWFAIDKKDIKRMKKAEFTIKTLIDSTAAQNQIVLYTDDSKPWQLWAPWCGYFENLNWVEVIGKDLDTKIYL